jgi:hypothetical protein
MHPLGLGRHRGEEQMRFITSADFMRRSLFFSTAQVPQGSLVFLMEADTSALLAATTAACDASVAALGGSSPLGMLAFGCVARRGVLGHEGSRKRSWGSRTPPRSRR